MRIVENIISATDNKDVEKLVPTLLEQMWNVVAALEISWEAPQNVQHFTFVPAM
jgi:hypothetical protein